ncbi:restriction endonuclease subunit S [Staphylococcus xylosus]|uniref:restriction endonuclease subunit S n=1 Tax=Staphylococcus xylosus TaxID=1288 RepID=UPI003F56045E
MEYKLEPIGNSLYIKGRIGWKGLKKSEYLENGEYRIINGKSLTSNGIDWNECGFISKERYEESPEIMLETNDIVITKDGTIGKVDIVKSLDKPTTVASGLFVLRNSNPEEFNTTFIYYFLKSPMFKHFIDVRKEGSVIPHLYQKDFVELEIPKFHINKQKLIARILGAIDNKIGNNKQIIANLEELSQTLFKHWFVDFEFPDENGNSYKSSGGEMIDSELGIIPKLWNIKRLSDICIVTDGTHDSPKQTTEGYPLVTSKHLNKFDIDFSTTKLISKEDFTSINQRSKVEKNDILLSMIGTIGKLHFVNSNSINYAIKNVGLIKTSQIDYSTYIYNYINSQNTIDYIQQRTSGSTQQYISLKNLRSIPIISPTSNILKTYIDRNNNFFEKINQKIKENVKLIELRNTLLPKLMSGELEIPDDIEVNEDELSI